MPKLEYEEIQWLRKQTREEVCRSKDDYLSRSDAVKRKKVMARVYGGTHSVYQCSVCTKWHLTTQDRDKRRKSRNADISKAASGD